MKRITSKLTRVLVATLLCAAAATTVNSQEAPPRVDVSVLAARGEALVNADPDPLVIDFRERQYTADGPYRYSLDRNRNSKLAEIGAAIAKADPAVATARTASDPRILYWLGFDIATGIFGDPARGAQGNTLMGPGSQRIRDSLSPLGQSGFDASVKLHLSRNYKR